MKNELVIHVMDSFKALFHWLKFAQRTTFVSERIENNEGKGENANNHMSFQSLFHGILFGDHSLSFSPRFCKFECNTTSDWLNRMV